jgi:hypothetical protein
MVEDILSEPETLESAGKLLTGAAVASITYALTDESEKLDNMDSLQALGAGGFYSLSYDFSDEITSLLVGEEPSIGHSDYPEMTLSYAATYKALDKML